MDALGGFVNPFTIDDKDHLYCISSGQKMSEDIAADVLSAEEVGNREKLVFIERRLKENDVQFFNPIKKLRLKSMADMSRKISITTKHKKVVELKQQGNIAFQLLVIHIKI